MPGDPLAALRRAMALAVAARGKRAPDPENDPDTPPPVPADGYNRENNPDNPFRRSASRQPIVTQAPLPSIADRVRSIASGGQPSFAPEDRAIGNTIRNVLNYGEPGDGDGSDFRPSHALQRLNEGVTMGEAATVASPMTALRSVMPVQSMRDKLDKASGAWINAGAQNIANSGGDPTSWAAKTGMMAPTLAAAMLSQGAAIGAIGSGIEGLAGLGAARGVAGAAAMQRVLQASEAAKFAAGAGTSMAVTGLTTGAEDQNLLLPKGKLGAMGEDLGLGLAGHGALKAMGLMASRVPKAIDDGLDKFRNTPLEPTVLSPTAGFESAGLQKRLPAYSGQVTAPPELAFLQRAGERGQRRLPARAANAPVGNGTDLITPPPTEISPNAVHIGQTDQERELANLPKAIPSRTGGDPANGIVTPPPNGVSPNAFPVRTEGEVPQAPVSVAARERARAGVSAPTPQLDMFGAGLHENEPLRAGPDDTSPITKGGMGVSEVASAMHGQDMYEAAVRAGQDPEVVARNRQKTIEIYENQVKANTAAGIPDPEGKARAYVDRFAGLMEKSGNVGHRIPDQYFNSVSPLAGLAGIGIGGKEASDEENSDTRRLTGLGAMLAGTTIAAGGGGRGRRALEAAARAMKLGKVPDAVPDVSRPRYTSPAAEPAGGWGGGPARAFKPEDYLNFDNGRWQSVVADPTGRKALEERTAMLIRDRGTKPFERQTFADIRAKADVMGLDADAVEAAAQKRHLKPEEQLAAMDIVHNHMDNLVEFDRQLNDPSVSQEEKVKIRQAMPAIEAQTNNLLWAGLTNRTEAGRNLSFQRMAAKRTMDPVYWAGQAAKNLGGSSNLLTLEHVAKINDFIKNDERTKLASYVASLKPGQTGRVLESAYTSGLLTNPATYMKNFGSNAVMAGMETGKDLFASPADRAMTGMLNATLGANTIKRSRDFKPRTALADSWQGAKEGAESFGATMRGDRYTSPTSGKVEHEETRTGHPMFDAYMNMPGRLLNATDDVFKQAAYFRSLQQQRRLVGMPPAKDIHEALLHATPDMDARAANDALIATFQNHSVMGDLGVQFKQSLARKGTAGRLAGTMVLPFAKTPGAVVGAVAQYSPFALGNATADIAKLTKQVLKAKAMAGGTSLHTPEQLAQQIKIIQTLKNSAVDKTGRALTGTAIMAMGGALAQSGLISIKPGRTDRTAQDMGEVTGDPGATLHVGPYNFQIDQLSPAGNLMLLGAYGVKGFRAPDADSRLEALSKKTNLTQNERLEQAALQHQQNEDGKRLAWSKWGTAAAASLGGIGATVADSPVMTGLKRSEDFLNDPLGNGSRVLTDMATSVVPTGLATVARTIDGTKRKSGAGIQGLGEAFEAKIPGLSQRVPAALDALGTEVKEPIGVRLANLLSPARISSDRTRGDTDDARTRRLIQQLNIPLTKATQKRQQGETTAEFAERQKDIGRSIVSRLGNFDMGGRSKEQATEGAERLIARARQRANERSLRARQTHLFANDTDPTELLKK